MSRYVLLFIAQPGALFGQIGQFVDVLDSFLLIISLAFEFSAEI